MSTYRLMCVVIAVLAAATVACAGPITSVVVYGDSLSDNGNLYGATGQPPSPPYFGGRVSNGPVAVEQIASALGVPLFDFAWAGATTGVGNHLDGGNAATMVTLPGMLTELAMTQASLAPLAGGGLFIVWGGPNDFLSPVPSDSYPNGVITRAVTDIVLLVTTLQSLGVQHILVPLMPDLGLSPRFQSQGAAVAAGATAITNAFNAALLSQLPAGVSYFDTAAFLRAVVQNPAAYGLTNVSAPCLTGVTVCGDPGKYLFWDDLHPTTAADSVLARNIIASNVPEPGAIALVAAGLMVLFVRRHTAYRKG